MSTAGTSQALASSSSTITMGTTLAFRIDESKSILELVKPDGTVVALWGKTLQYAFATQQSMVTLTFTPLPGSDPVSASYVNGQGTTVSSTQQSGSAMLTILRPPSTGVSFDIRLDQGTSSLASAASASSASAISAPATSARTASTTMASTGTPSIDLRPGATSSSIAAGSTTPGPSARLQTRLVLTTVEPPPDPDARPDRETA